MKGGDRELKRRWVGAYKQVSIDEKQQRRREGDTDGGCGGDIKKNMCVKGRGKMTDKRRDGWGKKERQETKEKN